MGKSGISVIFNSDFQLNSELFFSSERGFSFSLPHEFKTNTDRIMQAKRVNLFNYYSILLELSIDLTKNRLFHDKLLVSVINSAPMKIIDEVVNVCSSSRSVLMIISMFEYIK